jgi:mono/diheme cytochrome c family protein
VSKADLAEAGRLFNINCAVCHGAKGEGNGPLATSGKVGGIKSLVSAVAIAYPDGRLFHIMTYGQNNMGSYASQLNRKQRWQIVQYVRTLQAPALKAATPVMDTLKTAKGK